MVIVNLDFVVDNYHPIVDDVDYAIDFYNKTKERIFRSNKFSGIKKIRKKLEKKTGHWLTCLIKYDILNITYLLALNNLCQRMSL